MIESLFLSAALSMPGLAFTFNPKMPRDKTSFYGFLRQEGRVLLIGGFPDTVGDMRMRGIKAFGVLAKDWPDFYNAWMIVSNPDRIGIKSGLFQEVRYLHEEGTFIELIEAIRLVEPFGYFLYDDDMHPSWQRILKRFDWERLPFRKDDLSIWQKKYVAPKEFLVSA